MKRMICLMLAMVLMFGLMVAPVLAVEEESTEPQTVETIEATETVETVEEQTAQEQETQLPSIAKKKASFVTSRQCVDLIKQYEGFAKYPMWDYGQWSVGYGSRCPDDKLAYYKAYGITEAEAEALLRDFLSKFENEINVRLVDKYNLKMTQQQFDAVLSFSYNCGTGWMYDSSTSVFKAVTTGATGAELIRSFSLWCTAGGSFMSLLMQRRLAEANMYLNGIYSRTPPTNYGYVRFDGNGGTIKSRVHGYDINYKTPPNCVATYSGYVFDGWYTDPVYGQKVTVLTAEHKSKILYAHWVDGEGNASNVEDCNVTVEVTGSYVNVRSGPGTNYTKVATLNQGDKITIVKTVIAGGYKWGNFADGWIALQYTNFDVAVNEPEQPEETEPETTEPETTEPEETEPETTEATTPPTTEPKPTEPAPAEPAKVYGTVQVSDSLSVRKGPGTGYEKVGSLKNNTRVEILEQKTVGSVTWGRISSGWISLQYVKLDATTGDTSTGNTGTTATVIGTGTVYNCTQLSVRSGPGTTYTRVGYVQKGTKLSFTEYKTVGTVKWGKISNGWVSMDYIKLDSTTGNTTTGGTTTGGTTTTTTVTGVVVADDFLRIRSGPGTSYAINGYLKPNDKVTITEQKTVGGVIWGKISKGWISLDYIKLDSTEEPEEPTEPETTVPPTTEPPATEKIIATGVVYNCNEVNVRSGAGTSYAKVGTIAKGTKVSFTEIKTVGGVKWGKTEKGWISFQYVKLDSETDSGNTSTGNTGSGTATTTITGVVNAKESMNVRSGPGTTYAIVGKLKANEKVTITETKTVNGVKWGKISSGWISMDYITVTQNTTTTTNQTRTVNATSLNVRSTPGSDGKIVNFLYNGTKVTILETKIVEGQEWGRISSGWICLAYTK